MDLPIAITEETPPDMLEGYMNLLVHLPDDSFLQYTAERSCAVMDLLVQIAAKAKLKPSDYILQPLGSVSSSNSKLSTYENLNYKPNTPIGLLNTQVVRLIPKTETKVPRTTKAVTSLRSGRTSSQLYFDSDEDLTGASAVELRNNPDFHAQYLAQIDSQVKSKSNYISSVLPASLSLSTETEIYQAQSYSKPFETTFRVKIHLPHNQLHVLRATPHTPLKDIFDIVCDERNFQNHRYLFVDPGDHSIVIDLNTTLQLYGGDELTLVAKTRSSSYSEPEIKIQKGGRKLQKWTKFSLPSFLKKKDKSSKQTYSMGALSSVNVSSTTSQRTFDDLAPTIRTSNISGRMQIGRSQSSVETRLTPKWPSAYGINENEDPAYAASENIPRNIETTAPQAVRVALARKKRPAPLPPQKPNILIQNDDIHASIKNDIDINDLRQHKIIPEMKDVQEEVLDNNNPPHGMHVTHSRTSSDSSGYHDSASVLSYGGIGLSGSGHYNYGSAPATFPRKIKIATEMELAKYHDQNLHFKTNTVGIEEKVPKISPRKKKVAPIPPSSTDYPKNNNLLPSHSVCTKNQKHDSADLDVIMETSSLVKKADDQENTTEFLKEEVYEIESSAEPSASNKAIFESPYASIPVEANLPAKYRENNTSEIEYLHDEQNRIFPTEVCEVANEDTKNMNIISSNALPNDKINSVTSLTNNFPDNDKLIGTCSDTSLSENKFSYNESEMNTSTSQSSFKCNSVDASLYRDSKPITKHTATDLSVDVSLNSKSADCTPAPVTYLHENSLLSGESNPSTYTSDTETNLITMPSAQTLLSSLPLTTEVVIGMDDITLGHQDNNATNSFPTNISSIPNTISSISTKNLMHQYSENGNSEEVTLRNIDENKLKERYSISSTASDPPLLADLDVLPDDTKKKDFKRNGRKNSASELMDNLDNNLQKKKIAPIPPLSTETSSLVNKTDCQENSPKYWKEETYEMESSDEPSAPNKAIFESPYASIPVDANLPNKYQEKTKSEILNEFIHDEKNRTSDEDIPKLVNRDSINDNTVGYTHKDIPNEIINSFTPLGTNFHNSENVISVSPVILSYSHIVNAFSTTTHTSTDSSVNVSHNKEVTNSVFPPNTYVYKKTSNGKNAISPTDYMTFEYQDQQPSNVTTKNISMVSNSLSTISTTNSLDQCYENGNSEDATLRNIEENKLKTRNSVSSSDPSLLADLLIDVVQEDTKKKDFRTHRRQNSASYLVNTLDRINNPQTASVNSTLPDVFVSISPSFESDTKDASRYSIEPPKNNNLTLEKKTFKPTTIQEKTKEVSLEIFKVMDLINVYEKKLNQQSMRSILPKKTTYQNPPEVKFGTWNERPKKYVALKSDSDYKISTVSKNNDVNIINRNISMEDNRNLNTVQKNEKHDNTRSMNRNSMPSNIYRQISLVPIMKSSQTPFAEEKQSHKEVPFGQNTLRKTGFRKSIIDDDALNINSYSAPVLDKNHFDGTNELAKNTTSEESKIVSSPRNSIININESIPKKHNNIITQIPKPPKLPKSNLSTKEDTADPRSMLLEQIKNASNLIKLKKTNYND